MANNKATMKKLRENLKAYIMTVHAHGLVTLLVRVKWMSVKNNEHKAVTDSACMCNLVFPSIRLSEKKFCCRKVNHAGVYTAQNKTYPTRSAKL
jgi:hypothetical protein